MKILIIDDDLQFINKMSEKLKEVYVNVFIDTFTYVPVYNELNNEYTVIFIDILIGRINGIEIAKNLKKKFPKIQIVFISNYHELIFQTQEISPLCFIRKKEFDYDFMIFTKLLKEKIGTSVKLIFNLDKNFSSDRKTTIILQSSDIIYVECFLHKIIINIYDKQYIVKSSMKDFFKMVRDCHCFYQIHRSYVINMNYVYRINENSVNMIDENIKNELELSRKYRKDFLKVFEEFLLL